MSDITVYCKRALITVFADKEMAVDMIDIDLDNLLRQLDVEEIKKHFNLVEPEEQHGEKN